MKTLLHFFDSRLWTESPLGERSTEFSPLFVDRYRGHRREGIPGAHAYWELSTVIAGSGTLTGDSQILLKPFTISLIPAGQSHAEQSSSDLDTIWIGFHSRRLPGRGTPPRRTTAIQSRPLAEFVERLWLFSRQTGSAIGPELDAMTATAVSWFLRVSSGSAPPEQHGVIDDAVRHLDQNHVEPLCVGALARHYNCSAGYFHRLFKRHTGCSPMAYVTRTRMQHAVQILRYTDLPIAEVGRQVGYEDPLHFSRRFHQVTGLTPSACRTQSRP